MELPLHSNQFPMPLLCILLMLLFSLPTPACAATDTISAGHPVGITDKLVSSNGKFALGFFQTGSKSSDNSLNWYLGIWFNKVPKLTPAWVANAENPITDPTSSELKISDDGNLVILNEAKSMIWSSQANMTTNHTIAVLLNSGNLVLQDVSNSSNILWQSFDHMTDTFLPGGKIGRNKVTGLNRRLVSNKNLIDPAPGVYSYELDPIHSNQFLLLWNSSMAYWSSGDWNGQYFSSIPEMSSRTIFNWEFVSNDQEVYFTYSLINDTMITRHVLDVSGQLETFFWLEGSQNWMPFYAQPKSQCDVYAVCGPFTLCNDNILPFCNCMKGFSIRSPWDWELDDRTGGCVRNTPLHCGNNQGSTGATDQFYAMPGVRLPENASNIEAGSASECAQACLSNCSCAAYSYGTRCSIWHAELLNVREQYNGTTNGGALYLRIAATEVQNSKKNKRGMIIGVVSGASVVTLGFLSFVLVLIWRNKRKWSLRTSSSIRGSLVVFRYIDLQQATNNFSDRIGGGSFGSVFKGFLHDSTAVAVKRLDSVRQGEKQFRAEVSSIGMIQHINLVKLIGFCSEGTRRLLVYEHMPNRSLDIHLFQSNATFLNWSTRYRIALGIARGLAYLHENCRDCIIHCDIKPQNILLDASFVPKIADFGMAKFVGRDFSRVLTTMRGTIGYLAPEWITGVAITTKVDVYSYGMVLLEIISGRRNSHEEYSSDATFFPVHVASKLLEGNVECLMDHKLHGDVNLEEVERACRVACWCIQDDEFNRPRMGQVVQFLEGLIEINMPPMPRLLQAIVGI